MTVREKTKITHKKIEQSKVSASVLTGIDVLREKTC